jgi:membrane protein
MLKATFNEWMNDKAMKLSAALALYAILSLAPLLVISVKILSLVWRNKESVRDVVMQQMTSLMGSQAAGAIQPMLDSGSKSGSGMVATVVGTVMLLFAATGVFVELQDSMNTIWKVPSQMSSGIMGFIRNRVLSAAMVFGIAFLLLTSMFVSALLTGLSKQLTGGGKVVGFITDTTVSFLVVALLFAAIYRFLPDTHPKWRYVWSGALLSSAMFTIGKYGLALYFKYASPTSAFGAAGSLAAVLLWVYYSSFILFFGAEFTKVVAAKKRAAPEENPQEHRFHGLRAHAA